MVENRRAFVMTALAFVAGFILASAGGPSPAVADASPSPAPVDIGSRVAYLERAYKGVYADIQYLKNAVRQQAAQSTSAAKNNQKNVEVRTAELEKKFESHSHEYLQEGRASDGSVRSVPNDQFSGQGLNSTGIFHIGKPVIH